MKKLLFFTFNLIHVLFFAQVNPQSQEWKPVSSAIKFKIKNAGFNVEGSFGNLSGKIFFDPEKIYGNSIDVTVDSKTVNTNSNSRDEHLRKADYFSVEKHPKITLKATVFSKEKDGSYKGFFKLTIKDKTQDVVIPFTFIQANGKGTIRGIFTLNRLHMELENQA